mmetsp:Transcript_13652/g.42218  ORF Transcript_13652/g.42218 Transcript_13652/m.42218 type:complete len:408 (+) Transcript_13652:1-1224(+)
MGLGKTLQTISFIAWLKFEKKLPGPVLVICPLSVLSTWTAELARWCRKLSVLKVHATQEEERDRLRRLVSEGGHDVVVTTYEMAKSKLEHEITARCHWRCVVLDEGHIIKNEKTDISRVVRKLHCATKLLLTGTPLQNDLGELWGLLNWLYPAAFPDKDPFKKAYDLGRRVVDADALAVVDADPLHDEDRAPAGGRSVRRIRQTVAAWRNGVVEDRVEAVGRLVDAARPAVVPVAEIRAGLADAGARELQADARLRRRNVPRVVVVVVAPDVAAVVDAARLRREFQDRVPEAVLVLERAAVREPSREERPAGGGVSNVVLAALYAPLRSPGLRVVFRRKRDVPSDVSMLCELERQVTTPRPVHNRVEVLVIQPPDAWRRERRERRGHLDVVVRHVGVEQFDVRTVVE